MEKEFCTYSQALRLKVLGFDEPCFGCYLEFDEFLNIEFTKNQNSFHGQIASAPTFSQAFRWFRENHNLFGQVNIHTYFIYDISNDELKMVNQYDKLVKTYEEAELACLDKLIEIVESKSE